MIISKQIRSLVSEYVDHYSKYSKMEDRTINVADVPQHAQEELAALIFVVNPDLAAEATGPDNDLYESKMMPALVSYLKNTLNVDTEYDFRKAWTEGTTKYLSSSIDNLLQDALFTFDEAA